jgi:ABC-type bacteriocin/lantibiotic exporter with double-glycine peptidase domain
MEEDNSYSGTRRLAGFDGQITADNISFSYSSTPLLAEVDFATEAGSWSVITGPSGSGKTTLLYLLLGIYRPHSGRLRADDEPYDEIDLGELRRQVAFVPQDPIVFSGTVLENITYGSAEVSEARARDAARLAKAHDFIMDLPEGYETVVGESGALFSGGQRQRITLARAFYRRPKLLLLDEPTNQLDDATAEALYDSLRSIPGSPAVVVVTHDDRAALRYADHLYSLTAGRLERLDVPARMAVA